MTQTKRILAELLQEMLQTKSLEKITVKQLVDACHINRQTFYYHFHDIYELVEYMFWMELDKIFKNPIDFDDTIESHLWEKTYYTILYAMTQHKTIIMNVFHSIDKQHLEDILYNLARNIIIRFLDDESKEAPINEEDKIFIADFYKYAFVGVTLDWVNHFMRVSPETVVIRVSYLVGEGIKNTLNNYRKNIE